MNTLNPLNSDTAPQELGMFCVIDVGSTTTKAILFKREAKWGIFRAEEPTTVEKPYEDVTFLTYAKNIKTPLLIIHAENDLQSNIEQAEQLFTTFKLMKKKVEFIRFPGESHGISRNGRPDRRIARLEWIVKWFDRYLK